MKEILTLAEWYDEFCSIYKQKYGYDPKKDGIAAENWEEYYEDGYTPGDALDEEMSYAD